MDDLMSKLQNVLNDEESMNQIKELAGMLTGNGNSQSAEPAPPPPEHNNNNASPDFSQLMANLSSMMGSQQNAQQNQNNTDSMGIDMQKLMQIGNVLSHANANDKNVQLLMALRPLLKEENQQKVDRLIKIFKLFAVYPEIKKSGLLGDDLFGLL